MAELALVEELISSGVLRVEDGNHGEYRPRPNEFTELGIPFIRAADLDAGVIDFAGAGKINAIAMDRIKKGVGAPGDVILSHKGTVGKVAQAPLDAPAFVCSPQTTFWRSLDTSIMDARFLRFALESHGFVSQLEALKSESDMAPYVSLTQQRRLKIPLPPLPNQRAIADVLGALDDKIAANTKIATTADELAGALIRSAIDPAGAVPLKDVAEITMGSSPPGETFNEHGEGVPFFQGVRDFGSRFPSRRVWTTGPTRWAERGDLLVSVRAPVGRVNVAPGRLCVGRGLAAVRARDGRQATLYHLLQHAPDVWLPFEAEGTVFGSINRAQLHALELPVVKPDRIDEAEARLDALEGRIRAALSENDHLAATREVLLPALMSGRLRVEEAVERVG